MDLNYLIVLGILTMAVMMSLFLSLYAWRQRSREEKVASRYLHALATAKDNATTRRGLCYDPEHAKGEDDDAVTVPVGFYCMDMTDDAASRSTASEDT